MKTKSKLLRRFSALMLAFMLCLSCTAAPTAFALESSASEPAATSEASSAVESQASSKSAESEPVTDSVPGDTAEDEAENEGILSARSHWMRINRIRWSLRLTVPHIISGTKKTVLVSEMFENLRNIESFQ